LQFCCQLILEKDFFTYVFDNETINYNALFKSIVLSHVKSFKLYILDVYNAKLNL
jgi:hypothetical protein